MAQHGHLIKIFKSKIIFTKMIHLGTSMFINISTKLGTNHPCVKGIQICSNEGPLSCPRGDNYKIAKIH